MYFKPNPQTIKCKVLARQGSLYDTLVLQDYSNNDLLMLTVFPNWQGLVPEEGEEGFIEFEFVEAGKSTWFNKIDNKDVPFLNTYLIFRKFVKTSSTECGKIIL